MSNDVISEFRNSGEQFIKIAKSISGEKMHQSPTNDEWSPANIIHHMADAEAHAEEDKKRKEEAEIGNTGESLVYQTEKLIKDNDDKLPEDVKSSVQADVDALKSALAGEDFDAVKTAFDTLVQWQQKLGEEIYKQQPEGEAAPEASAEDVVDAEVIDDEEKK